MKIGEGLSVFLREHGEARAKTVLNADHPLWKLCKTLQATLEALPMVKTYDSLRVRWSLGQGAWARIPWLALLDARVTRTTSVGFYVIYLFREDSTGVYIALSQGVGQVRQTLGLSLAREELRRRARILRSYCGELETIGFALNDNLDLRSSNETGADYAAATAAHKLYDATKLPREGQLTRDLEAILSSYRRCVETRPSPFGD